MLKNEPQKQTKERLDKEDVDQAEALNTSTGTTKLTSGEKAEQAKEFITKKIKTAGEYVTEKGKVVGKAIKDLTPTQQAMLGGGIALATGATILATRKKNKK